MEKKRTEKIVNIVIHIILLFVFLFGFTYVRFFVGVSFFIISIVQLIRKKWLWFVVDLLLVVCLYFWSGPSRYPETFYKLEQIRFEILQEQYQEKVENLIETLENNEWFERIKIENWLLSEGKKVWYRKSGDSVLILFETEATEVNGYAWYSDEIAYSWMDTFYKVEEIEKNWVMYQMY